MNPALIDRWWQRPRRQRLLVAYVVVAFLGLLVIWAAPKLKLAFHTPRAWDFSPGNDEVYGKINELMFLEKDNFTQEDIDFITQVAKLPDDGNNGRYNHFQYWVFSFVLGRFKDLTNRQGDPRNEQAVEIVTEIIRDPAVTQSVKVEACLALLYLRDTKTIPILHEIIKEYPDNYDMQYVAGKALYALNEKEGTHEAYENLVRNGHAVHPQMLVDENDTDAREMLLRTLAIDQ